MFFKKAAPTQIGSYDPQNEKPILKCSICNGEQVAGFKNLHTGEFREIMLIRTPADLTHFKETYQITEVTKEY